MTIRISNSNETFCDLAYLRTHINQGKVKVISLALTRSMKPLLLSSFFALDLICLTILNEKISD